MLDADDPFAGSICRIWSATGKQHCRVQLMWSQTRIVFGDSGVPAPANKSRKQQLRPPTHPPTHPPPPAPKTQRARKRTHARTHTHTHTYSDITHTHAARSRAHTERVVTHTQMQRILAGLATRTGTCSMCRVECDLHFPSPAQSATLVWRTLRCTQTSRESGVHASEPPSLRLRRDVGVAVAPLCYLGGSCVPLCVYATPLHNNIASARALQMMISDYVHYRNKSPITTFFR